MAKRKAPPAAKGGGASWIMTYGDMMSLLLTFFVLIVSFSSIQESKFKEASLSLSDAFGVMKNPPSVIEVSEAVVTPLTPQTQRDILYEINKMEQSLVEMELDQEIDITVTEEGVLFRINAPFLFGSGQANLRPETIVILKTLAGFVKKVSHPLKVEGHTDSIPISTPNFPSNWELSAVRAVSVARFFQQEGVAPQRMSAVGYGEFHPLADNNTPEGRAKNRRVEIFMPMGQEQELPQELPLQNEETSHGG